MTKQPKKTKFKVPKGPCDPQPPKRGLIAAPDRDLLHPEHPKRTIHTHLHPGASQEPGSHNLATTPFHRPSATISQPWPRYPRASR